MRKAVSHIIFAAVLMTPLCVGDVHAKSEDKGADKQQAIKADQEAKRRKELENTEWQVTLFSSDSKSKNEESGSLVFQNNTLSFKGFKNFDIGALGYTLTAYEDSEKGTWETFKTTKDGNISVRGDWEGQVMNGIISEQSDEGKTVKVRRFTSVNAVKPIDASKPAPAEEKAIAASKETDLKPLVSATEEAKVVSTEKKKRR